MVGRLVQKSPQTRAQRLRLAEPAEALAWALRRTTQGQMRFEPAQVPVQVLDFEPLLALVSVPRSAPVWDRVG